MNMQELEKLDVLRQRFKVTYAQAKEAMERSDGDLVNALVFLEEKGYSATGRRRGKSVENGKEPKWDAESAENFVRGLIEQIKTLIQEGNVTKVRLISGEKTLIEIPATIGVVGLGVLLFSPLLLIVTAVGAAAAVAKEMAFEVEKSDGTLERRNLKFPAFGGKKDAGCDEKEEESKEGEE
jgi:ABC-type Na+ efflux pump permease subunit